MRSKIFAATLVLCGITGLCAAQNQEKKSPAQPAKATAKTESASARTDETVRPAEQGISKQQVQAVQADIKRMRVLLQQMQYNLASVTSSQDPLRHQFELEVEMWQILLNQMERNTKPTSGQ